MKHALIKDFADSNYQNPKIIRNKKNKRNKITVGLSIFLFLLIIVGLGFVFISPYFRIQNVQTFGLKNIKEDHLNQLIAEEMKRGTLFRHDNILLFDSAKLIESVSSNYYLDWIDVEKSYRPPAIYITLTEKVSALAYHANGECFNIDIFGSIIEKCNGLSAEFIQISDARVQLPMVGENVISEEKIDYIIKLNDSLQAQGMAIKEYKIISNTSSDIRALTEKGFEIYFNQKMTVEEQLTRFNVLIREQIGPENLNAISYVDLRFGEKVFYK
ncbi:MAG: cell division protein FtsQ/DivIB [Patescibacteria group bacterium]